MAHSYLHFMEISLFWPLGKGWIGKEQGSRLEDQEALVMIKAQNMSVVTGVN